VATGSKSKEESKICVLVSLSNGVVTERLREGAIGRLKAGGYTYEVVNAPGSFELPQMLAILGDEDRYKGFVVVGCILRGETPHWEHLSVAVLSSLLEVATKIKKPVGLAVLTVESLEQGFNRAGGKFGNKGWEAASAVLSMLEEVRRIKSQQ